MTHNHKLKKVKIEGEWTCRGLSLYYTDTKDCLGKDTKLIYKYKCDKCKDKIEYCYTCATRSDTSFSSKIHKCNLLLHNLSGWDCDGSSQNDGCQGQKNGCNSSSIRDMPGFGCRNCNWDLCDRCIVHYNK